MGSEARESMHWSRWGDPDRAALLPEPVRTLVRQAWGLTGPDRSGVALEDVRVPDITLPPAVLDAMTVIVGAEHVGTDHESRVRHTRGRSTSDLLKLRAGDAVDAPDVVLRPGSGDEILALLALCSNESVAVVPFGGGTSVVGGLTPQRDGLAGVAALDLGRMNHLLDLDEESQTAELEVGLRGPEAEDLLARSGFMLGHHPQSFEYATIGGFAAARSSGQSSAGHGRFDEQVVGLRVATPIGMVDLGRAPASAAGPDLRQVFLGSEGAFGVITSVTVRVRPVPPVRHYEAWRFDTFRDGLRALRVLAQSDLAPTVLRLSDEVETAVGLADQARIGGASGSGVLMVTGYEGTETQVQRVRSACAAALAEVGGESLGTEQGRSWLGGRYDGPYLRDSLLDAGALVETVETATFWSNLLDTYDAVRQAFLDSLGSVVVLTHVSHVYPTGASLYFTVVTEQGDDPVIRWSLAKDAVSRAIVAAGATITHHHGVGRDHLAYLTVEIGDVGVEVLRAIKGRLDPAGILNPGVLIP